MRDLGLLVPPDYPSQISDPIGIDNDGRIVAENLLFEPTP
jgi:hypothetical protein